MGNPSCCRSDNRSLPAGDKRPIIGRGDTLPPFCPNSSISTPLEANNWNSCRQLSQPAWDYVYRARFTSKQFGSYWTAAMIFQAEPIPAQPISKFQLRQSIQQRPLLCFREGSASSPIVRCPALQNPAVHVITLIFVFVPLSFVELHDRSSGDGRRYVMREGLCRVEQSRICSW